MAGTISVSLTAQYTNGGDSQLVQPSSTTVTVAGAARVFDVVSVGTSAQALSIPAGTLGFIFAQNLDAANYIELSPDGTTWTDKLLAGEFCWKRPDGWTAVWAKANTAAVLLKYAVFNN